MKKPPPCPAFGLRELTRSELSILRTLAAAENPLTVNEINDVCDDYAAAGLAWLYEAGLVTKQTMPVPFARAGRPPTWYFPTRAGQRLVEQLEAAA